MLRYLISLGFTAALAAQSVLKVGPGGFPEIAAAVAVASPGDVIEVASGIYMPFTLDQGLTIRAAPGAFVRVQQTSSSLAMTIRPPVGQLAVLARLNFLNPGAFDLVTRVERGTVWFEECTFGAPDLDSVPALAVVGATVLLRRCHLVGFGWAYNQPGRHNDGLSADQAQVFATDCSFEGSATALGPSVGGAGIGADNSLLHCVNCQLRGGPLRTSCGMARPGPGLRTGAGTSVWLADCHVEGGQELCVIIGVPGAVHTGAQPIRYARTTFLGGRTSIGRGAATVGAFQATPLLGAQGPALALSSGGSWQTSYRSEPNWPIGVFLATVLDPHPDPLTQQPMPLPVGGATALALLVADAQGAATYATSIPAVPALLGATCFVAAVSGTSLPLQVSPPVGGLLW